MSSRWLRIALLAWTIVWYGYTVPSHERGRIQLGGGDGLPTISALASCCATDTTSEDGEPGRRPAPSGRCAVCYVAAVVVAPPPLTVYQPCTAFVRVVTLHTPAKPFASDPFDRRLGRAPPVAFTPIA